MSAHLEGFGWRTDLTGRFTRYEGALALWLGEQPGRAGNAGAAPTLHPNDKNRAMAVRDAAMAARAPFLFHARLRRADGVWVWCVVHGWPIRSARITERYDGVTFPVDVLAARRVLLASHSVEVGQQRRFRN